MTVLSCFAAAAVEYVDKPAVIAAGGRLSYAHLDAASRLLAEELVRQGAKRGDRVAVWIANSCAASVAVWGALRAGCVLVPIHAALRGGSLLAVLGDAEPHYVVAALESIGALHSVIANMPTPAVVVPLRLDGEVPLPRIQSNSPSLPADDDLASILYTSGSTGVPKGVMLSHGNMEAAVRAVNAYLGLNATDVIYSPLPLSSSYGLYQLILGLSVGSTVVLDRSFSFPAQSLTLLATERATVIAGVPTMYAWLARTPMVERFDLSHVRLLTSAAAALPVEHAQRVRKRFPNARLYVMYGQTECKRISYLHPDDLDRKPGSIGRGMPFQEHAVIDESGARVPPGGTGQLVVRGPHVMQGYWRNPSETARKLRPIQDSADLWLHTEDLVHVDGDGYLYFVGRTDDIIKVGGNKVSPLEVEDVICRMPQVFEVAVVGIPDDTWGAVAKAFIVLEEGLQLDAGEVLRFCARHLRPFMIPKSVAFVKHLPKTESGKVRKSALALEPAALSGPV